jgi:tetratricopeptide (TPR) repeat protein
MLQLQSHASSLSRQRRRLPVLLSVLTLLLAPIASAEPRIDSDRLTKAEALATEAKAFFQAGLFDKASSKFMEAYALSQRPSLMYNAARSYEEGGNLREALALLKAYRSLPSVDDAGRADADSRIARIEAKLAGTSADPAKALPPAPRTDMDSRVADRQGEKPPPEAAPPAAEGPARPTTPPPPLPVATPMPPPLAGIDKSADQHELPWWQVGGGAALIATSLVGYSVALSSADDARAIDVRTTQDKTRYLDLASQATTLRNLSVAAAVAGVAVWGWGAWEWLAPPPAMTSGPVAGWPRLVTDGQSLTLVGQF